MKKTNKEVNGTSFYDTTINTTLHTLRKILGEPRYSSNDGEDKVNFEWNGQTSADDVFTVYDWKEYRSLGEHEMIEFHIGGHNKAVTEQAKNEIQNYLYTMNELKVQQIIEILREIDIDGETMQYILKQVGMEEQMATQLTTEYSTTIKEKLHELEVEGLL